MATIGKVEADPTAKHDPTARWWLTWNDAYTLETGGSNVYIDPKTLKPCKHHWVPAITETAEGWTIKAECAKCGIEGSPDDKGVSLKKLVRQMG